MKKFLIILCLLSLMLPFTACNDKAPKEIVLFPCAGRSIDAKAGASFTVANSDIATIDDSGLLIALKPGTTEVTVKSGNKTTVYPVTVLDPADYIDLYDESKIEIQNSDILAQMEKKKHSLLLENATWMLTNSPTEKDDRVTINYEGKVDGKKFKGGSAEGTILVLGSGSFIDGFEDGLIGKTKGSEVILNLTFPAIYENDPSLAGKAVTFTVTITKVERPEFPEFDNDFVKEHAGYENINDFDREEYRLAKTSLAISALVEGSKLKADPPKALYDHYYDQYILRLQTVLLYQYNTPVDGLDDILEVLDISAKELRDSAEGQLAASVLQDCVFHGFAYKNGFLMSDEEFAEGTAGYIADNGYNDLDDLLSTSGLSLADVRELVNMDYLSNRLADMVTIVK